MKWINGCLFLYVCNCHLKVQLKRVHGVKVYDTSDHYKSLVDRCRCGLEPVGLVIT